MKTRQLKSALICSCLIFSGVLFAQTTVLKSDTTKVKPTQAISGPGNEEKNRNVSDNASSLSSPRDLNIGLPGSNGGITIVENNLPVPYYYWPFMPFNVWRADGSFDKMGLSNLATTSNVLGKVGYAVTSFDRFGTDQVHGNVGITTNDFGLVRVAASVAGPLGKGWYYTASGHFNADPGTYNPKFMRDADNTQIFKAGLTKRFKNGEVSVLYKFANSTNIVVNQNPFFYHSDGSVTAIPGFKFGLDGYMPVDGQIRTYNMKTGELQDQNLKNMNTASHTIDVVGKNNLGSGWNLDYTLRYLTGEPNLNIIQPAGTLSTGAFTSLKYADNGETFVDNNKLGQVQMFIALMDHAKNVTNVMGVFDLNKKFATQNIHFGMDQWYDKVDQYTSSTSMFLTEIAPNPRKLVGVGGVNTDQYGFFNNNASSEYHNGWENKLAFYFSDEWKVTNRLQLNLGVRLEAHILNGDYLLDTQDTKQNRGWLNSTAGVANNYSYADQPTTAFHNGFLHKNGSLGAIYKLTKPFGLTGSIIYNEKHGQLENYSGAGDGNPKANALSTTIFGQGGIYLNLNKYLSLVSQVTYANRSNVAFDRTSITNPGTGESVVYVKNYGVQTLGWTTDFISNPFKNFNIHCLLTLQSPKYQDYAFDINWTKALVDAKIVAQNNTEHYDFSGKGVTALSKTLIEIEPAYTIDKFKIWARARYFGQQYANVSDALIYQGRWETFVGADYNMNKKSKFALTVINPLNQLGVQGSISNSDLITDASKYEGKIMAASYIIPFTVQLGYTYNF
ncbi:MAG: hypothetical protein WCJ61_04080 [Paludibacter sp.]